MINALAISWIQGEFYAVKLVKGRPQKRWCATEPVVDLSDFNQALSSVCKELEVHHDVEVSIVYESDLLSHSIIQVPPLSRHDLYLLLCRRAQTEKSFKEEALWTYRETLTAKEGRGVILHLLPRHFVEAIVRICEEYFLTPKVLVPLSEVMARHIKYHENEQEVSIIVSTFGSQTKVLVICKDGVVLFLRDLPYTWEASPERLGKEIERSILYAKQRFNAYINQVWVAGKHACNMAEQLSSHISIPVMPNESMSDAYCWAIESGQLAHAISSNFIPRHVWRQPFQRLMFRACATLVGLLVLASTAIIAQTGMQMVHNADVAVLIETQMKGLMEERNTWRAKYNALDIAHQRLDQWQAMDTSGVPARFLSFLGNVLPNGLVLLRAGLSLEDQDELSAIPQWSFVLDGYSYMGVNQGAEMLEGFEHQLVSVLPHAQLTTSSQQSFYQNMQQGGMESGEPHKFLIEGECG